jgi:acetolactate synthase-1/2/3 large subunit
LARQRGTDESRAYIGQEIDRPAPDFAGLARSMGCHGEGPIVSGDEAGPALRRAIEFIKREGRPALVDTITRPR